MTELVDPQTVQALGLSLLHFLWQGAALAALLFALHRLLREAPPQVRYLLACATLLAMVAAPLATFALLREGGPASPSRGLEASDARPNANNPGIETPTATAGAGGGLLLTEVLRRELEPALPALVALWTLGVFVLSLRSAGGFLVVQRLKRRGLRPPSEATLAAFARVRQALRVPGAKLYESALVAVPTVIGWLRPVVLVPASAISGLTVAQLELILAHELAHVRRADYLVNLLQTAAETLLFYHPAVHWVSNVMRVEREHCCDDLAVAVCGSRKQYAQALADLGALCSDTPALAMAATGGSLFDRIARLVGPAPAPSRASRGLAGLVVLGGLTVGFTWVTGFPAEPEGTAHAALIRPIELEEWPAGAPQQREAPQEAAEAPEADEPSEAEEVTEAEEAPDVDEPTPAPPTPARNAKRISQVPPVAPVPAPAPASAPAKSPTAPPLPATPGARVISPPTPSLPATPRAPMAVPTIPLTPQPASKAKAATPATPATPAAEPRAFPLESILEMASAGVTPEYIEELEAAGFKSLTAEQLVSLRSQGVSAEYVRGLREAGLSDLSLDQILSLRSQGVSASYVKQMKAQGLDNLSVSDLHSLRAQGVTPELVEELKKAGYADLSVSKLVAVRAQGVTPRYIVELKTLGYDDLGVGKLMALRAQGVTPEYIRGLNELGYAKLELTKLLALRAQGVTPNYVRELSEAGCKDVPVGALLEMRAAGVTPEFVKAMKEAGLEKLEPSELVALRSQGIRPEMVKRLRGRQ